MSTGRVYGVPFHRGERVVLERNPAVPDPIELDAVRSWCADQSKPTAIDLFCGAGGLSLGLEEAGFAVLVGADSDPLATETYAHNLEGLAWTGDLSDANDFLGALGAWGIEHTDLVAGGVPCQPFSRAGEARLKELVSAGLRPERDSRAELWQSFLRVVAALEPKAVLVENVPDLPRWNDGAVLVGLLEGLRGLGYTVDARVLGAYEQGVPQHRARLLIVGTRDGSGFVWPRPVRSIPTLRDAIGDLPPVPGAHRSQRIRYLAARQRSPYQRTMRAGIKPADRGYIEDHVTRDVRADDHAAYDLLPEGGTYADLPEDLQRYRTDIFTDKYKRLAWDELSRSITAHIAKDGYWYIHPDQHRTLSIREAARIQSFPDRFRFAGEPSHRYRQIGNAVPPLLGKAIGQALFAGHKRRGAATEAPGMVRQDLERWHSARETPSPWRTGEFDAWTVLAAEICLGRLPAKRARRCFDRLRTLAVSPAAVHEGSRAVRDALAEMGLEGRADPLLGVARALCRSHGGEVPSDELDLRSLPGVGEFTAQAVSCFGFGRVAPLVDQRTARVISRLSGDPDADRWQVRLDLHLLAGRNGPDRSFNHAFLDLAAEVCSPGQPACGSCPVAHGCASASSGAAQSRELAA